MFDFFWLFLLIATTATFTRTESTAAMKKMSFSGFQANAAQILKLLQMCQFEGSFSATALCASC